MPHDRKSRIASLLAATLLLALGGCSTSSSSSREPLTEAQRDSVLATESMLPGSRVVGGALETRQNSADKSARLNAQLDSLTR